MILKGVGPDEGPRGLAIEMVLLGGKHRTVAQFRELAREAGLKVVAAEHRPACAAHDNRSSGVQEL